MRCDRVLLFKLEGARASTGFCVDVKPCVNGRIGRVAPPHDAFLRPIYSCAGRVFFFPTLVPGSSGQRLFSTN